MSYGTSKHEGTVTCPKCGKKGYQKLMVRFYSPRTGRFKGRREYRTRVVEHKLPNGKRKICVIERLSPIYLK